MSGPKRGTWRIVYDPTPGRLADLERFVARQDAWLEKNGPFIRRFLGEESVARAVEARDIVQECINQGDPNAGFNAYGGAWALFNQLHREATDVRNEFRVEEQRKAQRAVAAALDECEEMWNEAENQALLQRWLSASERADLAAKLRTIGRRPTGDAHRSARDWRRRFEQALRLAGQRSSENARALRSCVPALQAAIETMDGLNVTILSEEDRGRFESERTKLRQFGEDAVEGEDLESVRSVISRTKGLTALYEPKVKAAELKKATEAWQGALVKCGYAVNFRTERDGTAVLEASSFPMKSVNIRVCPESREIDLVVNGKQGHGDCIRDVQALQAELARQGMELRMTDWGRGNPGGITQRQTPSISIGGRS
jgi:hypothetical protein